MKLDMIKHTMDYRSTHRETWWILLWSVCHSPI